MRRAMITIGTLAAATALAAPGNRVAVFPFEAGQRPANLVEHSVTTRPVTRDGQPALAVDFEVTDWPNAFFTAPGGTWDWSRYAGLEVSLYNPGDESVTCCMRVDNEGADGLTNCNTATVTVPANGTAQLACRFNTGGDKEYLWGMRGIPVRGPLPSGPVIDPSKIVAFQVFLPKPSGPRTLVLTGVELFGEGAPLEELVPLPFVDRFGQYRHAEWQGKIGSVEAMRRAAEAEQAAMDREPAMPERDAFGGWSAGPRREATGWFRTELVDGKWWLVTPEGTLFFSVGPDCVGTWEKTWVSKREPWFEWLPARDDPEYGSLFSDLKGAHSMAEPIGGEGVAFSFYCANLIRKYGPEWQTRWRDAAYARLRHWGFNTVANWSQGDVLVNSPMPFVASGSVGGRVQEVEGAKGYWGRMPDVYSESFAKAADESMAWVTRDLRDNPRCIGYFIDNELSWETVRTGVLNSPPEQPARKAFIEELKQRHGTLAAVNAAWGTAAADWDALRVPGDPNEKCRADLDHLEYSFAKTYFEGINRALKAHAPNQLYLGCRFSGAPPQAVRACTDVVDIVSFNRYEDRIAPDTYSMDKPIIIGEFHFGALDRGMFHTGLVGAKDQEERARKYAAYVRAVLAAPQFVGCHWFQFIDEPITGRWYDGENYNIGFLTVTDTPYPELVESARAVHRDMYRARYGNP